ncbi:glycosyltransferase family 2 protein [Flavobacterium sp. RHBU_3]|uniref:glycosyltransferase family 2 protein n=1 Tax=Flavobacterium sp. RHBU_3 TaxID=3391184 RepID=UPI0039849E5A
MISVLIPAYNYDVSALVQQVYAQLQDANIAFEIIVCDDASTTGVLQDAFLASYPKLRYLRNDTNLGRTLTRKKLAETARYNNLLFLDADVIPVSNDFITAYLPYADKDMAVFGGYAYKKDIDVQGKELRVKFGRKREEIPADVRNHKPYSVVFSGNFLISKALFNENNYPADDNFYGMDLYFGYSLYKNHVKVLHIDNPIYHLGLESNEVFFRKSMEAVENRKALLQNYPEIAETNGMLKQYTRLKKWKLKVIAAFGFQIFAPLMKKMIFAKNPNLLVFDLYRLGYLCSLD